jgi:DNA polymerase-3 subunit gamma/tau
VFKNIIEQNAALQLREDIISARLAPSMLFFGPFCSGKGSTALELARILSCEGSDAGGWKCVCSACEHHRYLQHTDLLLLGPRPFQPEIAAACNAFLKSVSDSGASQSTKIFFIRSLRKLMGRFSTVFLEEDTKLLKETASLLQALEEGLSDFEKTSTTDESKTEMLCISLVESARKLEHNGISNLIPVSHIRRAVSWSRFAPSGKHKTLIIEKIDAG